MIIAFIVLGLYWLKSKQGGSVIELDGKRLPSSSTSQIPSHSGPFQYASSKPYISSNVKHQGKESSNDDPYPDAKKIKNKKFSPKSSSSVQPRIIESYFSQNELSLNGQSYDVSDELYAISSDRYDFSMGEVVLKANGHIYFQASESNKGRPVLFNKRTKQLAVMTGKINLIANSKQPIEVYSNFYSGDVDSRMSHLGRYSIQVRSNQNIFELFNNLQNDSHFKLVELEVIEGIHHAK